MYYFVNLVENELLELVSYIIIVLAKLQASR